MKIFHAWEVRFYGSEFLHVTTEVNPAEEAVPAATEEKVVEEVEKAVGEKES